MTRSGGEGVVNAAPRGGFGVREFQEEEYLNNWKIGTLAQRIQFRALSSFLVQLLVVVVVVVVINVPSCVLSVISYPHIAST